jgi:two-component system, NtrC family, sensor kinase
MKDGKIFAIENEENAELHYRNFFNNAVQGIFRCAQSGKLIKVNGSLAKMLGYDSPKDMIDSAGNCDRYYVQPERREELLEIIGKCGHVKDFEFQACRKDGTKAWLSQNTHVIGGSDSKEIYFEGIVQDISDRKRMEEILKATLARQEALLAAVPDIIMEVNENKICTWANQAGIEFFGDDVIGKDATNYFDGNQDTYDMVQPLFTGSEKVIYVESWQRRRDGQKRLLAWWCRVLKNKEGTAIGAISSARDITDSKLEELARTESLIRQVQLNQLERDLLGAGDLTHKLKLITEGVVDIFKADFCRIWLMAPGDLCKQGCMHATVREGSNACQNKDKCLRLIASSGRYTHTNGAAHQRIPFGARKIGRIASAEERILNTNDVASDPSISDHDWAKKLGLVSFAGFQLPSASGESLGVLALFSTNAIAPEELAQMDALCHAATQVILRAQAEAALRESDERFRLIAETIDEVFWISDIEEEKILYISPAYEHIWGYPRQKMYENRKFFRETLHPEDYERVIESLNIQKTGQPYDLEYRIIRSDGSVRQIWDRGFPVRDGNGRVRIYVGIARDITTRRNTEKELQETKDYLKNIFNCIGDPVFVKDRQLKFLLVNDAMCAFSRRHREEMIGLTIDDWMPKHHADLIREQEELVFNSGKASIAEEEVTVGKNNLRTVRANKALLKNKHGEKQIVGVIRDITELRQAEQQRQQMQIQLQQAQKLEAIGQLAAGIAHEINTPTQYVGDNIHFLQDAFGDLQKALNSFGCLLQACHNGSVDPTLVADVETAVAQADLEYLADEIPKAISQSLAGLDRVATIVRAMKEFSHPGGDEKQNINLNHAIENTVMVCRNEWKYVSEVVTDLSQDLPLVPCLPADINQAILNLVVNAAHAIGDVTNGGMKSKGTIAIRTRRDGNCAEIRISDTGTGILEKNRSKIFTMFFTTKEPGKGTGQGLALCHAAIVGKHGGTIEFETEVGKGTTFIIRLPLMSESVH